MPFSQCDPIIGYDWIAVDLDGTLAKYEKFLGCMVIGEPIPLMVERVKGWLMEGRKVLLYTARVAPHKDNRDQAALRKVLQDWCQLHLGAVIPITCIKSSGIAEFWDDRAVRVEKNTGRIQ